MSKAQDPPEPDDVLATDLPAASDARVDLGGVLFSLARGRPQAAVAVCALTVPAGLGLWAYGGAAPAPAGLPATRAAGPAPPPGRRAQSTRPPGSGSPG